MRLPALLALTVLFLLAGCASPKQASDVEGVAGEGISLPEEAPLQQEAEATAPQPVTVTCEITRTNVGTTTGYGLNIDRVATGIDECPLEGLFDGDISWSQAGLVEATWSAQASQTGTDLWLESGACPPPQLPDGCTPPHTMGASSPLRLELTADELRAAEGQDALVMVSGQGFVNELTYTLHVTLFPDAIPAGFTAVTP